MQPAEPRPAAPRAVALDVIGTLFPLTPLQPRIAALGLPPAGLEHWFATATRDAFALAAAGDYRPFADVLAAALDTVLAGQTLDPPAGDRKALLDAMGTLDARPDARDALAALARAGVRCVALTNGGRASTEALFARASLAPFIDRIVSTDEIGVAKPVGRVYHAAADAAGMAPDRVTMVAVHPWDLNGAAAAGLRTAFLDDGRPYPSTMRAPDCRASSLGTLIERVIGG